MTKHRVAVVQAGSIFGDLGATIAKAADLVTEAAKGGAALAVFPEALLGGYPKGASFRTPVGMRFPEGRDAYQSYHAGALDLESGALDPILDAVAATGIFVVIGVIERDGGTLYCTALFLDGQRGIVGKHRKLMPTAAERLIWGFGDGSTMPVIETQMGRVGAVICWENYMPMMRMAMYDKGVTLYCAPTADDRDTWLPSMQHIALEGRCHVLTACQYLTRDAFPADYETALGDEPATVMMRGGSAIVGPLGTVLAGPNFEGEVILYADIETNEVIRGKYDFDVAGHYARPDIFNLTVDERQKSAVSRLRD